jgi:dihydroxy-acid dehydratase
MGLLDGPTSYADEGFSQYLRRVFLASAGYDDDDLSRPVVGIGHTMSDYTSCHRDMPALVDAIAKGVLQAGGLPMAFPTMSLPETMVSPTTMLYRNLLAMQTEEAIRSHPMDAVVLVGGCDKTVPAQMMAAVSADIPYVQVVVGPMMTATWRGERLGACTDCRRLWGQHRAGQLSSDELSKARERLATTAGTCTVMGTASTMAAVAEVMGVGLPGSSTAPAPSGDRLRIGRRSGRLAVTAARENRRPSQLLSPASFRNAAVTVAGLGGSTNAIIHLLAIAGRTDFGFALDDVAEALTATPVVVDCKPIGSGYLPDLHDAGGLPAVLRELRDLLQLNAQVIEGGDLSQRVDSIPDRAGSGVVRRLGEPVSPAGGLRVLHGSLAPRGALIKAAAASPELRRHRGRAVVFDSPEDAIHRLDSTDREIQASDVLVLRNAGPVAAGMPEAGAPPIPTALSRRGVSDMVRVSDGRMSGTSYGTVVLHVAPEAAVGGPLGLVREGDEIELDIDAGRLELLVEERQLEQRRSQWKPPEPASRGWRQMYGRTVLQADQGADLDFLTARGDAAGRHAGR